MKKSALALLLVLGSVTASAEDCIPFYDGWKDVTPVSYTAEDLFDCYESDELCSIIVTD